MSITAITVTYNSAAVIAAALSCVYRHPDISQCIVIDNASTDDTVRLIEQRFPEVKILVNQRNLGFAAACNLGLYQVRTEFALLLNPDATIDSDGINALLEGMQSRPHAAIIAPDLTGQDRPKHILPAEFISGAIALWRMALIKQVGFFDPAFFLFYEDNDVSARVRKAGYEMLLMQGINAQHPPGHSCALTRDLNSLKLQSSTWSRLYMTGKYKGVLVAKMRALFIVIRSACAIILSGNFMDGHANEQRLERKQKNLTEAFDKQWPEILRSAEGNVVQARQAHENNWKVAILKHEKEWQNSQRTQESRDRLKAALYFLHDSNAFAP